MERNVGLAVSIGDYRRFSNSAEATGPDGLEFAFSWKQFMQIVLVMFRSDGGRRSFSIARDMTVVGRREDCDLRIPLGDVSRKHCRLVRDGSSLRLEDLGSSNGTYHNGKRVDKEADLSPGDSIQIGPVVFVLQVDGVPADDELHPVTVENAEGSSPYGGNVDVQGIAADRLPYSSTGPLPEAAPFDEMEPMSDPIASEDPEAHESFEALEVSESPTLDEDVTINPSGSTDHLDAIDIADEDAGH